MGGDGVFKSGGTLEARRAAASANQRGRSTVGGQRKKKTKKGDFPLEGRVEMWRGRGETAAKTN